MHQQWNLSKSLHPYRQFWGWLKIFNDSIEFLLASMISTGCSSQSFVIRPDLSRILRLTALVDTSNIIYASIYWPVFHRAITCYFFNEKSKISVLIQTNVKHWLLRLKFYSSMKFPYLVWPAQPLLFHPMKTLFILINSTLARLTPILDQFSFVFTAMGSLLIESMVESFFITFQLMNHLRYRSTTNTVPYSKHESIIFFAEYLPNFSFLEFKGLHLQINRFLNDCWPDSQGYS